MRGSATLWPSAFRSMSGGLLRSSAVQCNSVQRLFTSGPSPPLNVHHISFVGHRALWTVAARRRFQRQQRACAKAACCRRLDVGHLESDDRATELWRQQAGAPQTPLKKAAASYRTPKVVTSLASCVQTTHLWAEPSEKGKSSTAGTVQCLGTRCHCCSLFCFFGLRSERCSAASLRFLEGFGNRPHQHDRRRRLVGTES